MKEKQLKKIIIEELEKSNKARANDNYLIYRVFKRMGWETDLQSIAKKDGVNRFVSIARIRRLLQAENPMLLPSKEITAHRKAREERFRDIARGLWWISYLLQWYMGYQQPWC